MLIRTIHVKAAYRLTTRSAPLPPTTGRTRSTSCWTARRKTTASSLYDQRVSLGLQAMLLRNWTASLSAGYVFDRYSFEGTSLFSSSDFDRVNLGSGPFVSLNLGVRY